MWLLQIPLSLPFSFLPQYSIIRWNMIIHWLHKDAIVFQARYMQQYELHPSEICNYSFNALRTTKIQLNPYNTPNQYSNNSLPQTLLGVDTHIRFVAMSPLAIKPMKRMVLFCSLHCWSFKNSDPNQFSNIVMSAEVEAIHLDLPRQMKLQLPNCKDSEVQNWAH